MKNIKFVFQNHALIAGVDHNDTDKDNKENDNDNEKYDNEENDNDNEEYDNKEDDNNEEYDEEDYEGRGTQVLRLCDA